MDLNKIPEIKNASDLKEIEIELRSTLREMKYQDKRRLKYGFPQNLTNSTKISSFSYFLLQKCDGIFESGEMYVK